MLIKQANQKSVMFVTIGIFKIKVLRFKDFNVCSGCNDLLMMSTNLDDIAILNINGGDYRCIISRIRKSKVVNLLGRTL